MIRRLVRFALRQRLLVLGAVGLLVAMGVRAFIALPIEAFPDVEDIHVQIISQWPGHAAEEIERSVTLPIERQMNGAPHLSNLRSTSMFGLSVVTMTFDDATTDNFARQQALERLQGVTVPNGVSPALGSLSNSTGEIYRYTVQGSLPITELKSLEDWVIEPALRTVPGVADVVSFGGQVKQYQIDVDPAKLAGYGIVLPQVEQAVAAANLNAGGGFLSHGYEKQVVRGIGLFGSLEDIANVVVASRGAMPIRVRDIGTVQVGGAPREGIVAKDRLDDVVEGIVLMRKGENALTVLDGVRQKTEVINATLLPHGTRLVPFYDRATLVHHTVRTVQENLAIGAVLVLVILIVFLGDWRSAVIVGLVIPLSLLGAFILMDLREVSANLISLGAVDFGIIVDAAVVLVEAFLVRLALSPPPTADQLEQAGEHSLLDTAKRRERRHNYEVRASVEKRHLLATITEGMGRPILFSKAIIITAFLPIFTFQRVEKRIFSPMAYTLTFALLGSLLLSLTLVPVLASYWLRPGGTKEPRAARWLQRVFAPVLDWALARPKKVLITAGVLLVLTGVIGLHLGTEFLPELDEGNIWLTVTMPVGISLDAAKNIERQVRGAVLKYPQVSQLVSHLGRPDDGTDAKGANNLEVYADLKPRGEWRGVRDKDDLVDHMQHDLEAIPGVDLNFSQYIKDNVEEALSGVKGELVVKIFGSDLSTLQQKAAEVQHVMSRIHGVADLGVEQQFGQPQLRFVLDREALARNGVSVAEAADALETAVGGRSVTQYLEGSRVYDVRVRFTASTR
ncbi:MAG: efflux RND transporter permease subunit, partial [Polaromonas sp.]|nr:efflux RND transporter permease subunit [Gemmatimonadaceae bacterium]